MHPTDLELLSAYNRWANARLYAAALDLHEEAYRAPVGVFFGSLRGTLNHLLTADLIWLRRITGTGEAPDRLDAILHDEFKPLARARLDTDARFLAAAAGMTASALAGSLRYTTTRGVLCEDPLGEVLTHVFNHQTHHRGQAHACLSILTGGEPPALDFLMFRRGVPAPDLAALVGTA